ncbi:MAG: hypothetical protein MUC48_27305 [Leptolyngbya sp. Prado105]|jgi:hypothetical protein|nr:hypothetical protein [Leptolyngbya sp. Prado105]
MKHFSILVAGLMLTACSPAVSSLPKENQPTNQDQKIEPAENLNPANTEQNEQEVAAKPTEPVKVYDGRDLEYPEGYPAGLATEAEKARIAQEFQSNLARIQQSTPFDCASDSSEMSIVSTAEGAFTQPNTQQKAFLYEKCRPGRIFGLGGVIIFEGTTVVAHQIYGENGLMNGMFATPDLNQNGVSEIVFMGGSTNQGYTGNAIALFELNSSTLSYLGRTTIYTDNSGAVEGDRAKTVAYRISAQPAATPIFFQEIYEKKGHNQTWTLIQKSQPLSLSRTEPDKFVKIK